MLFRLPILVAVVVAATSLLWKFNSPPKHPVIATQSVPAQAINAPPVSTAIVAELSQASPTVVKLMGRPDSQYFEPGNLYDAYLADAQQGDIESQIVINEIISYCRGAPTTQQDIDRIATQGAEPVLLNQLSRQLAQCAAIRESTGDLDAAAHYWYEILVDSGHPLITIRSANQSYQELRANVRTALRHEPAEAIVRSRVYFAASSLYSRFPGEEDTIRQHAWFIIYCIANPGCVFEEYRSNIGTQFHDHQIDDIFITAEGIAQQLAQGNYEGALSY